MTHVIPVRTPKRDPPRARIVNTAGYAPNAKGAPVVAKQNARLVGGYTAHTRQRNPPPVAYLNNLAKTWNMPWAIRQRLVAPADKMEVFIADPRGIVGPHGAWQAKEDYFRNLSVRGMGRNPEQLNPERTPHGISPKGKPYQSRGLTYRFLPSPDGEFPFKDTTSTIPIYRGW